MTFAEADMVIDWRIKFEDFDICQKEGPRLRSLSTNFVIIKNEKCQNFTCESVIYNEELFYQL